MFDRLLARAGVTALVLATVARAGDVPSAGARLRFERDGALVRELAIPELAAKCGARRVEVRDPYYGRAKTFWACPLARVLDQGFAPDAWLRGDANYFLRALDGYTRAASGAQLAEPGAYLAFADAERGGDARGLDPRWEPIDRRQLDPGPSYLVWQRADADAHRFPWPYQLACIEQAPFEAHNPHTSPADLPASHPAWRGFALFRRECVACHAVNGEGGRVGPELNVPRSIVEYRPAEQLRAFIRDPQSFRYTSMPAHAHLSDADLDALLAYFRAMSERKFDPQAPK
jgi:mono/diheme cytochrome c family protein